ncbi:minor capsid protein [Blastococcus mobilis]|uniref:Uncharacterized protein n=1 Tax=Blastococcus mobilis TaxID=1938746 RepID=A0A238VFT9_9ACTN|nr:minor capsid protein [Blastococcus mobilis]SNR33106.1 hypothetical protein SAMN06272737_10391 [Blastococcus mobilis]
MFAAAVLRYLHSLGIVTYGVAGADAFLNALPDKPVEAVAAYGRPGGAETDGGHGYDEPAAQFIVRGDHKTPAGRRAGYARAVAIRDALHGLAGVTIAPGTDDETYVVQCLATQSEPTDLGGDPDGRPRWSVPVRAEVYRPTALRP